jgi:hypothetical protein
MPLIEQPPWEEEFDGAQLEVFRAHFPDDARGLIAALRADVELAAAVARADVRPQLVTWFSELAIERRPNGWAAELDRSGALGEQAVGVEWRWQGVHDDVGKRNAFNGIAASNRRVEVHGFTVMSVEDGRFVLRRYVDWAGLWAQLGLTLNWRTPVTGEPPPADPPAG